MAKVGATADDGQKQVAKVEKAAKDAVRTAETEPSKADGMPDLGGRTAPPSAEATQAAAGRLAEMRSDPGAIRRLFETGEYPYEDKLRKKPYERQAEALQIELLKAQRWVKETEQKVVVLFEGRDAAGKGGTIKRFTEHMNP